MIKNFIVEILHVTKQLRAKELNAENANIDDLDVNVLDVSEKANIKSLNVESIVDNGSVYGESNDVKSLTTDPAKNVNYSGKISKPARVDHVHKIPDSIKNPKAMIIKDNSDATLMSYDGSSEKSLKLTPDVVGAPKKNHASTTTDFGVGSSSQYGHVKLSDSTDSTLGADSGVAASPKAIDTIRSKIEEYLPLAGGTMRGAITTPVNDVGLLIGSRTEILDDNLAECMVIRSTSSPITSLGIGSDNSTILQAEEGDGTLYLKNLNATLTRKTYGEFNPIRKRAIIDHVIEKVFVGTDTWVPERSGNYRLYIVGGGGNGGNGVRLALGICDGGLRTDKDSYDGSAASHFDTMPEGNGFTLPGYGGGGGGVCVVDLYIDPSLPPYKIVTETVKDEDGYEYEVDTLAPVRRMATFTFSGKQITVTGLDSISGGEYYESDKTIIKVYGGSNAGNGVIARKSFGTNADGSAVYGCSWYKDNSDGTYVKGTGYTNQIAAIQTETGETLAGLAPDTKPEYPNSLFGEYREWNIYTNMQGIMDGDCYYVKQGTKWKCYDSSGVYMSGYDLSSTQMAMYISGCETRSELNDFLDGQSITAYLNELISDIPTLKTVSGKWVEFMYNQSKYASQFVKVTYGTCGIGGYAEGVLLYGESYEYFGGYGDDITTIAEIPSEIPETCIATGQPRRAFGYGGGIPGGNSYIGIVGGGGCAGGVKYLKPKEHIDGVTTTYDKDGVRSGTGGSICIQELGRYYGINDSSTTPSATNGGVGYYGGGGGGGAAILCGNGSGKTTSAVTTYGAGGKPCVIIAYLGG